MPTVSVTVELSESLYDALRKLVAEHPSLTQDQAIASGIASYLMANGDEKMVAIAAQSYAICCANS